MTDNTPGKLEALEKRLYSREGVDRSTDDMFLSERHVDAPEEWKKDEVILSAKTARPIRPLLLKIFFGAALFFLAALAFSLYYFFADHNLVSTENIDVYIAGPTTVDGGDPLSFQISIHNRNTVGLEESHLLVEYPEGSRLPASSQLRSKENLDTIGSGAIVQRPETVTLFGEEGDVKKIHLTLDFKVKGSNATFYKEADYEVILGHSPVRISVGSLKEVTANQASNFTVTVTSNSPNIIKNILLKAEYPFGFKFTSATPGPFSDNSVWLLGDIKPQEVKTIKITGVLIGQDEEQRVVKFSVGNQSAQDERKLDTVFTSYSQTILIKKPFLGISLAIDEDTDEDYSAELGKPVRLTLSWENNLADSIQDARLQIKLKGSAVDKKSVIAEQGFYQSLTNTIVWDQTTVPELATIGPGEKGQVSATFSTDASRAESLKNPEVEIEVDASGKRVSGDVSEQVVSQVVRKVKFVATANLLQQAFFSAGPFKNAGPMPPQAEKETTYTIVWTLSNASNIVRDGRVVATLPPYIRFLGETFPASENVSFKEVGRQVVWEVGDLAAGVSGVKSTRQIAFKIGLLPSLTQVGATLPLVNEASFSGQDQFANTTVSTNASGVTTRVSDDPQFKAGDETIVK